MSLLGYNSNYLALFIYIFCCYFILHETQGQVLVPDIAGPLSQGNCPENKVQCNGTSACILSVWMCDGDDDCGDGSDEEVGACLRMPCAGDLYSCQSNRDYGEGPFCIYRLWVCDGEDDCRGGEDEREPHCESPETPGPTGRPDSQECLEDEFTCNDGKCIPMSQKCDHFYDCLPDGDDEQNCAYRPCNATQFMCAERQNCIDLSLTCGGTWDCGDGSDEVDSLCNPSSAATCQPGQFTCKNGQCIDFELVCNTLLECDDGSDELHCNVNECTNSTINKCTGPTAQCRNTLTSYKCMCDDGYRLKDDGITCEEINECKQWPQVCAQTCVNNAGSYVCSCTPEFTQNGSQCTYTDTNVVPWLLYANRFYIHKMKINGTANSVVSSVHLLTHVLDYDYSRQKIYFADADSYEISEMNFDGTDVKKLYKDNDGGTEGVAVDWVAKKLYWTTRVVYRDRTVGPRLIRVSELNGTNIRVLFNDSHTAAPRAIVVHPGQGFIFWTDWSLRPFIGRAWMDGTHFQKIVTTGIYWPNAITVDYFTNKLYFADARIDNIMMSNLDGSNRITLLSGLAHVYSVNIFEEWIFWADWNTKQIERANRYTGMDRQIIANLSLLPYDMHIYHPSRQPNFGNACAINNGGCSHLCLIVPNSFVCACPTHFTLQDDRQTCQANCNNAQFLCGPSDPKCIPQTTVCDGVVDCAGGEDEETAMCAQRNCPSSQFECTNYQDSQDCINRLYVCDGDNDCSDSSDEDTTLCTERDCLPGQFRCNSGKCISNGWKCDGDDDCSDGSDEDSVMCAPENIKCGDDEFRCDNNKCIPQLWFCDYDDDCGDQSDEPREQCNLRPCPTGWFRCRHNYRCIPDILRCNGEDECRDNSDEDPALCPKCQVGEFECDNGGCIPERWRCNFYNDCDDNSDEDPERCEGEEAYRQCTEVEFQCTNSKCIRDEWRCNLDDNCGDNSDEIGCTDHVCPDGKLQCGTGHCYSQEYHCDGKRDCEDLTDESSCPTRYPGGRYCAQDKFDCGNGVCISKSWVCDADDDCGNGHDETDEQCQNVECDSLYRFQCNNSRCIYRSELCNGYDDCGDGSDENNFTVCANHKPRPCDDTEFRCANHKCLSSSQVCNEQADCGKLLDGTDDLSDEIACYKQNSEGCGQNNGNCEQVCVDLPNGGHYCKCYHGFKNSVDDPKRCEDINECESLLGHNCTQVCVNIKPQLEAGLNPGYSCGCYPDFERSPGSDAQHRQCHVTKSGRETLLIAIDQSIRQFMRAQDRIPAVYEEAVNNGERIKSIDVDARNRMVYWTDSSEARIYRAVIPVGTTYTTDPQDLEIDMGLGANEPSEPDGIAYDWVAKNIYWSDIKQGNIKVATENGTYTKTLITSTGLKRKPTSLAVNPARGLLYWVDIALKRIESADMDGSNEVTIMTTELEEPTGLAIDYWGNGRLYWCDMKRNVIYMSKWDGSDATILLNGNINNPYSLDVFGNNLYWVSLQSSDMRTMDKFGRGVNTTVQSALYNAKDVKMFHSQRYKLDIPNPCRNAGCFPLCLLRPGDDEFTPKAKCVCPDGYDFLSNRHTNCRVPLEAGLPYPNECGCKNYGSCVRDRLLQAPTCLCPEGFGGDQCEIRTGPTTRRPAGGTGPQGPDTNPHTNSKPTTKKDDGGGSNVTLVAVIICVIFVILLAVILVVIYLYRSGRLTRTKTGHGEFRPGSNAENNAQPSAYDYPQGVAQSDEVTVDPGNSSAQFVNPLYYNVEKKNGHADGPKGEDSDYAQIANPLPTKAPLDDTNA